MDDDLTTLALLVGDIERFEREHWGIRSLHRRSGASFDHLLSIARIEDLLASAARRPTFRLVRDGVTLPPERSTRPLRLGGRLLDDVADITTIGSAMHEGATLVMQGLQRTVLEIAELCRALERATSHPVQANAYLTPAGAAGLAPHSDEHDVFVVQVAGHKDWTIDDLGEVRVEAGDVVYLPRGVRHSASAQDEVSLHLTVGVLSVTYVAVVRRMLDRLDDDDLRRPLPIGFGRPGSTGIGERIGDMVQRAADGLLAADPGSVAALETASSRRRRRALGRGHLRNVLELDALGTHDRVRRRRDVPDDVSPHPTEPGRICLALVDRRLVFPAEMGPALLLLLNGEVVRIGDLPGLEDSGRLVLVRRLVREAVLDVEV